MKTPVVLTVFNRPGIVARVFSEIAKARPSKLYVIADGPRANRPGEAENCAAARSVIERIDWDCEVLRNYSDTNLGPRRRLSTGINWVFEHEEEAIILEHDCLPHPTFFPFCEQLLAKYRNDQRVMHINGSNFLMGRVRMHDSYDFSRITHSWGFATWRRAWQFYDVDMKAWPALRNTSLVLDALMGNKQCAEYFTNVFDQTHSQLINTWDYQWLLTCWRLDGLSILPKTNLISNIGFGEEALYCADINDLLANVPFHAMRFPLQHPLRVEVNREAEKFTIEHILMPNGRSKRGGFHKWLQKIRKKLALRMRISRVLRMRMNRSVAD